MGCVPLLLSHEWLEKQDVCNRARSACLWDFKVQHILSGSDKAQFEDFYDGQEQGIEYSEGEPISAS